MYIGIKIHKRDYDRTYYQTVVFESSVGNLHQTKKKSYKEPGKQFFDALQSLLNRIMNKKRWLFLHIQFINKISIRKRAME